MKRIKPHKTIGTLLRCALGCIAIAALSDGQAKSQAADARTTERVEALIYTTMPSKAIHRPEMAMDGDATTYYRSTYGMDDGDTFLVLLSRPITAASVTVTTGDAAGNDVLTNAVVEISPDGDHFTTSAPFDKSGLAKAVPDKGPIEAIRIRLNRRNEVPALVIREIVVETKTPITHVQAGPGRGFYDLSEAPDLTVWAQTAERQMEESWADTDALLYTGGFIPPNMVNVIYRTGPGVTGVAATGGGVMTVNSAWCRAHADDTGLTVHETAHVIQAYSAYDPVWLVEGIADYIRWVRFEPEHYRVRLNPATATYHDSYRTTAAFLGWCEIHYDSRLVTKLNNDVRFGHYNKELFKDYCGKDVDTLWAEFIAAYKADPVHVITPPVAAADQPRVLPQVTANSSVPVDLAAVFNVTGITKDTESFPVSSGFDSGGAAYSSTLLGSSQTVSNVTFHIGAPGGRNTISCKGQTVTIPAGVYASIWVLGSGVEGNQMAQQLTVTYSDGTTDKLYQNFSDWYKPQAFPGEVTALRMDYRNMANGVTDRRHFNVYVYGFGISPAKTVTSVTLPDNENLKLLAISLAK